MVAYDEGRTQAGRLIAIKKILHSILKHLNGTTLTNGCGWERQLVCNRHDVHAI